MASLCSREEFLPPISPQEDVEEASGEKKKKEKEGEKLERPTRSVPCLAGGRQRYKRAVGDCSGCMPVSGSVGKELIYWPAI